ncbi:MAG: aldo/keto reductase, partial [Myxococcota bacterium]
AIHRGIDLGIRHNDPAEMYGSGRVEELLLDALEGRRDEVYLVSKVLPTHASRDGTIAACERSLKKLGTDRLDLYLLHWPSSHALEETIAAFEQLINSGMILHYGVSNFDADLLGRAVALAGPGRVACNQVLYHLQERAIEHHLLLVCEEHDVALVAYSPFGSGGFPSSRSAGGRVLQTIAEELGCTVRQVALAYVVRRASVFTIPKSSTVAHVEENAGAGDLRLPESAIRRIDEVFPRPAPSRNLPVI